MNSVKILITFFFFAPFLLNGQVDQPLEVHESSLTNYDGEWGISSQFVFDILVAKNGVVWIGAISNLTRWDGTNSIVYNSNADNPHRINGDLVYKILETSTEDIVIVTQQDEIQMELLKKGSTQSIQINTNKKGGEVKGYLADLILANNGVIYAAFNEGNTVSIYQLVDTHLEFVKSFKFKESISNKAIKIEYFDQAVWMVVQGIGVFQNFETQKEVLNFNAISNGKELFPVSFLVDEMDNFWMALRGLEENVFLYNGENFELSNTPFTNSVSEIKEKSGQLLFIAGEYPEDIKEVQKFSNNEWYDYTQYVDSTYAKIFPGQNVEESFIALTKTNLLNVELVKPKVKNYFRNELKNDEWGDIIMGVNEDDAGNIYFLLESDYLGRLNPKTNEVTKIVAKDDTGKIINFGCAKGLSKDKNGKFWFSTCMVQRGNMQIVNFDPVSEKFKTFRKDGVGRALAIDKNNMLWIAYHGDADRRGLLAKYDIDKEEFTEISLAQNIPEPRYMHLQNDSTLWIGTMKGLVKYNIETGEMDILTVNNSPLKHDHIIAIADGPDNTLFTGTYGGGLQIIDLSNNTPVVFDKTNGLCNNYVCGILPIDDQRFWISTFDGISYFNVADNSMKEYGVNDGFSHHEFNRFAFYKSKDSVNYFGTVNGANSFMSNDLLPKYSELDIGISSIKRYYGEKDTIITTKIASDNVDKIYLAANVTYVELDFYQAKLKVGENEKLYTRLIPYDDNWEFAGENKRVRYRLLPPGTYKLEIKNEFSNKIKTVEIISAAPFYLNWWFPLICFLGLAGFFYWMYRIRLRNIKIENANKREINQKFAALELQALQSQLNPHFIFNALGAIQYAIRENDTARAEHFLTSFAALMRLFLESSKKKHIKLVEEIELIRRYVELEQLRFENRFDFVFEIDEKLDIYNTEIPSLLFQPFIENAINHGLFHKTQQGLLKINMTSVANKQELHCTIEDNGVGREKAAEIRKKSLNKHISRSTQIVNERIEILQKVEDIDLRIEIEDLLQGTRVVLDIPILEE